MTMDSASGTMRNISGSAPIGSPSTCANTGFAARGFANRFGRLPRLDALSFPQRAHPQRWQAGEIAAAGSARNSSETRTNPRTGSRPVVILNGPP